MWLPGLRLPPLEERRLGVDSEGRDSGKAESLGSHGTVSLYCFGDRESRPEEAGFSWQTEVRPT